MERIFYKKWTAIVFVAAILVLVLLVCMLLVTLTQMSSLDQRAEELQILINEAREQERLTQELLDYMNENEYVKEWAEKHDRVKQEDITWLEEKLSETK